MTAIYAVSVEHFGIFRKMRKALDSGILGECQCGKAPRREGQRSCKSCHAAYMREWRQHQELTAEQRKKDNARSYAGVYKRRGLLTQADCVSCGSVESQMHHEDYDQPLEVTWLCRPCHLKWHRSLS